MGQHFILSYTINVLRANILTWFKIFLEIIQNWSIWPIDETLMVTTIKG